MRGLYVIWPLRGGAIIGKNIWLCMTIWPLYSLLATGHNKRHPAKNSQLLYSLRKRLTSQFQAVGTARQVWQNRSQVTTVVRKRRCTKVQGVPIFLGQVGSVAWEPPVAPTVTTVILSTYKTASGMRLRRKEGMIAWQRERRLASKNVSTFFKFSQMNFVAIILVLLVGCF